MGSYHAEDIVLELLSRQPRSMRIAVVTETYPPEVNGVAMTVARVVDGLRRRSHEVQLIRPRQPGTPEPDASPGLHEVLMRGLPIPRYPQLRMGVPAKRSLVRLWSVRRPDIVHLATEGPLGWSALKAARQLRIPASSDFRTNFDAYCRHYGLGFLRNPIVAYLRRFHNQTGRTMVPTGALRDELARRGFRQLAVVSRGVDAGLFDPARRSDALRQSWGLAQDDLAVLCVGRIAAEKNLDLVIDAFCAIRRVRPSTRLVLVGDGPLRAALAQRHPEVVFCGVQRDESLARHYASADLFLFPSLTETFGNVTAEAMASGLPVVAYDRAAAAQWIEHGQNGWLVPEGDHRAFCDAALAAVADAAHRLEIGRAARQTALRHDWDRVVLRLEHILTRVIDEHESAVVPAVWEPSASDGMG